MKCKLWALLWLASSPRQQPRLMGIVVLRAFCQKDDSNLSETKSNQTRTRRFPRCDVITCSCLSQEDRCLFWTDRASSLSPSSTSSSSPRLSKSSPHPSPSRSLSSSSSSSLPPLPSTPRSFRPPLSSSSSFSPTSPSSAVSARTPGPLAHR